MKLFPLLSFMAAIAVSAGIYAQNPVSEYYGNGNYPIWTDHISWNSRIDMSSFDFTAHGCSECSSEFQKFEYARDLLYEGGGGILYYPAGTYDFSEIPDQLSESAEGRGLMLKSGVVILGEKPDTNDKATGSSEMQLKTKFILKSKYIKDINGADKPIPSNWSIIGCIPSDNEKLKDIKNIGIAWVEINGGAIYFGGQYEWGETLATAGAWYSSKAAVGQWADRIPDGLHPIDAFAGGKDYEGAGVGRLVFGCVFKNSAVGNHDLINFAKEKYDTIQSYTYPYKFGARIGIYGSDVLVANNYMPKPDKCFKYKQTTGITQQDQCNQVFGNRYSTLIYDYGKVFGLDINKGFLNPFSNSEEGYLHENVIVMDNNIYNHGSKGYEVSGNWLLVLNNENNRNFLSENDDVYDLGTGWELTLDGFYESDPGGNGCLSDNLSRAFDMSGKNGWIDGNKYNNTGSSPGNDGEGILWQAHGGMNSIPSFAITNNESSGQQNGYMAGWGVHQYGVLWGWNKTSSVGSYSDAAFTLIDVAIVSNEGSVVGSGQNILKSCPSGNPAPPLSVEITFPSDSAYASISWSDNSNNEVGFRVERKTGTQGEWKTLAIRPLNDLGHPENEQVWRDYLLPLNVDFYYRVTAINCDNNDTGASEITGPFIRRYEKPNSVRAINQSNRLFIYPNPAKHRIEIGGISQPEKSEIYDLQGKKLLVFKSSNSLDISSLTSGAYIIKVFERKSSHIYTSLFIKE